MFKPEPEVPVQKKRLPLHTPLGPKSPAIGYREYINSKYWARKRSFAIKHFGKICNLCRKPTVYPEVHHKHYETLYYECIGDVEVLCPPCHVKADEIRDYVTAYETYCEKKYGPSWINYHYETFRVEFESWLESKDEGS
jgi:hypothetical protein